MAISIEEKKVSQEKQTDPKIVRTSTEDPLFHEGMKVNVGSYAPEVEPAAPIVTFKRQWAAIKIQTLGTVSSKLTIRPTSFTTNGDGFYQLIFTDYIYDTDGNSTYGFFDFENDTELRINGVLMSDDIYNITETIDTIYVDFTQDLEFTLDANDVIELRARVKNA